MTGVQTCALPICFPVTIRFLQQAKKRVDDRVKEFAKASYESMIRKYKEEQEKLNTEEDNQGET